ncbi:universal stress protein [Salinicoccus kekensis]|uniref:Nucleotide-binding universal stress UspA family protein n=1 Tax=Salinicoccus kekensis TaxID=714307 RepID=A0A285UBJ9_9STAP|nr:universal stress protein [Salinicoccus kekensis]SOC39113.1 nucleotide-binding universal stress UspA family protein [Salinicoccus kekensis]
MYKKILLPFDFGNTFYNVPEQLAKLTNGDPEAVVTIFHIMSENEMADNVKYHGKHFDDITKDKVEDLKPFTDELDKLDVNYNILIKSGRVITELLREINENDYEIVVMSNQRARRELKHVLGHVTHKVAKRVNKPVLIVK